MINWVDVFFALLIRTADVMNCDIMEDEQSQSEVG